ncbi:immunity protein TriTu family protein [Neobacillus novalis]|nr:hypothetical protein [Neobacillus novalis]
MGFRGDITMDELFYRWFNDHKEKLQKMGIQTDLISKSIQSCNPNPSIFVDHLTSTRGGRVTVWKSGFIDMEILDIQSVELIFFKHLDLTVEYSDIENLLDEYIEKLISQS